MIRRWGLRPLVSRVIAAWIIVLTSAAIADVAVAAAIAADGSGCVSGSTIDPMAQARIRESRPCGAPSADHEHRDDGAHRAAERSDAHPDRRSATLSTIVYYVVGATLATTIPCSWSSANGWVIEAIQGADGTVLEGTVPEFEVYGGGGGDWD
jgi:hypothetical protein